MHGYRGNGNRVNRWRNAVLVASLAVPEWNDGTGWLVQSAEPMEVPLTAEQEGDS